MFIAPCAVLLRAAVALLVLSVSLGGEAVVGHALAERGAERVARHGSAYGCGGAASGGNVANAALNTNPCLPQRH